MFNISECDITNKDVNITITPEVGTTNYSYTIIKNDKRMDTVNVINGEISNINLTETGNYKIEVNINNQITTSGLYQIDKDSPIINIENKTVTLKMGDNIDLLSGVTATDNIDGDITSKITSNEKELKLTQPSTQTLIYTVEDKAGNITSEKIDINIINSNNNLYINQILLCIILGIFLIITFIYNKTFKLENRISKYSIKPIKDNNKSVFETFNNMINNFISRINKIVLKSEFLVKKSKKYEKYIIAFGNKKDNPITFISKKILVSIIFLIVGFIIETLRLKSLSIYEIVILIAVGYYALDLIYKYRYYVYRKQIENDLLQAIIVMNNAFKSGRSITQAIELVGNELTGAISEEFKKMSMELSFGLDIEVVFKRFAERIKIEEAAYLTSSLSILNKTGGNIIKVFTSIEKTLFNRKKLKVELNSLTGSSKLIMWVLTLVPICFVILINFINPEYFLPLYQNVLGIVIIGVIIMLYILYIVIVRKIMKIRM